MVYRRPKISPQSSISSEQQGRVVGRFCLGCGSVYSQHCGRHAGKPMFGKDHVSSPCSNEGRKFDSTETWWEPAVEVLAAEPDAASETAADSAP